MEFNKCEHTTPLANSGCGICGGRTVEIRGRYPHDPKRNVCPTCCAERLDQIREISDQNYGVTSQAGGSGRK